MVARRSPGPSQGWRLRRTPMSRRRRGSVAPTRGRARGWGRGNALWAAKAHCSSGDRPLLGASPPSGRWSTMQRGCIAPGLVETVLGPTPTQSQIRVVCGRGRNTTVSVPMPGAARRIALIWGRVEDLLWWRTKGDSARAGPEGPFGPLAPRPANGPYGGISCSLGRKIEFQATARAGRFAYRSISPPPANDPRLGHDIVMPRPLGSQHGKTQRIRTASITA